MNEQEEKKLLKEMLQDCGEAETHRYYIDNLCDLTSWKNTQDEKERRAKLLEKIIKKE